jgi:HEAT repeat protein
MVAASGPVAPIRLTVWVLVIATAWIVFMIALMIMRHIESVHADQRRARVQGQLTPVFRRFLETEDRERLAEEFRPAFMRMNAAERPVAALLVTELMGQVSPDQREQLRGALEEAGLVELGERGTRRRSPWRRALACDMLGKVGLPEAVPALLGRLEDRRPEVRTAAVRALGEIGSAEALPALSEAFLERRCAPTNVVNNSLRKIGGGAVQTFQRGVHSTNTIVRISSCFGLAGSHRDLGSCTSHLALVLASDPDARVRTAAATSLGILGGDDAPDVLLRATADDDVHVRRAAVRALGSFDDPTSGQTLQERTEDDDREVALRAAESLLALGRRPRAAPEAHARLESCTSWAVEYARTVEEVSA